MRNSTRLLSIVVGIVSLAALDAPARAAAEYDYDPSVDFSKYQTFRWLGDSPGTPQHAGRAKNDRPELSPLVVKQVGDAVKTELESKGLRFNEQAPADLGVAIRSGRQRDVVAYGWGPRYRGPRRVYVNREGVLTIDLVDRVAKELVWRGWIAATIKEDPEKLHEQIENLVGKVLKNYPPPKK